MTLTAPARAATELGATGTFINAGFQDINLKTRLALRWGGGAFRTGPLAHVYRYNVDVIEGMGGWSLRWGDSFLFAVEGGYLVRRASSRVGKGVWGALVPGFRFGKAWVVEFPLELRRFQRGFSARRWNADWAPFVGVSLAL